MNEEQFEETSTSDRIALWFINNRKRVIYGALTLIVLAAFSFRLMESQHQDKQGILSEVELLKDSLVEAPADSFDDSLKRLQNKIQEAPTAAKENYHPLLVQALLFEGKTPAISSSDLPSHPEYALFSKASLDISKGNYKEALKHSEELSNLSSQLNLLQLVNQVRLASLYQKEGQLEQEQASWRKLLSSLEILKKSQDPELQSVRQKINLYFSEGDVSLQKYAENQLNKQNS